MYHREYPIDSEILRRSLFYKCETPSASNTESLLWINELISDRHYANVMFEEKRVYLENLFDIWDGLSEKIIGNHHSMMELSSWIELSILIGKFSGKLLEVGDRCDGWIDRLARLMKVELEERKIVILLYSSRVFLCLSEVMSNVEIYKFQDIIFSYLKSSMDPSFQYSLVLSDFLSNLFDSFAPGLCRTDCDRPLPDHVVKHIVEWMLGYDGVGCTINMSRIIYARNHERPDVASEIEEGSFNLVLKLMSECLDSMRSEPNISFLIVWYRWLLAAIKVSEEKKRIMSYLRLEGWIYFDKLMGFIVDEGLNIAMENNSKFWFQGSLTHDTSEYFLECKL
jgi:hypothetical protein